MSKRKTATLITASRCRHIKADGLSCRAHAVHNSPFCFVHDPNSSAECDAARRKGGIERSRKVVVLPPDTPDWKLSTAADLAPLLAKTINQLRRGEIDPRISNAIGYLASVLLQVKQRDELEQRVACLESEPVRELDFGDLPRFAAPASGGQASSAGGDDHLASGGKDAGVPATTPTAAEPISRGAGDAPAAAEPIGKGVGDKLTSRRRDACVPPPVAAEPITKDVDDGGDYYPGSVTTGPRPPIRHRRGGRRPSRFRPGRELRF